MDEDNLSSRTRYGPTQEEQMVSRLDVNHLQIQGLHPLIPVVACHSLAFENFSRVGAVSDSPTMTKILMRAMTLRKPAHAVSFHHAGIAPTFCPTDDVDPISGLEDLSNRDFATDLVALDVIEPKLAQDSEGTGTGLLRMSQDRLRNPVWFLTSKSQLERSIAISLLRLFLHNGTWSGLYDRDRDEVPLSGKNLSHTKLLTY
jgi:hypothetical protein